MSDPSEKEQAEIQGHGQIFTNLCSLCPLVLVSPLACLPTSLIAGALSRPLTMLGVLLQAPLAIVMLQDCTEQVG